jgi:hypothetical protein
MVDLNRAAPRQLSRQRLCVSLEKQPPRRGATYLDRVRCVVPQHRHGAHLDGRGHRALPPAGHGASAPGSAQGGRELSHTLYGHERTQMLLISMRPMVTTGPAPGASLAPRAVAAGLSSTHEVLMQ